MVVAYRALNTKTVKDKFPLPRVDDVLEKLKNRSSFSSLDLASGYHQIKMDPESIPKTAFVTPDGQYKFI